MISSADILIDRLLSPEEITNLLAKVFDIKKDEIFIIDDEHWAKILSEGSRLDYQIHPKSGEFPIYLSLYVQDPALEFSDEENIATRICQIGKCRALIANSSKDPYMWTLIDGVNPPKLVTIETDTDEKGINIDWDYKEPLD